MERCPACGAEIEENIKYCPHCGGDLENAQERRDYWAERLAENDEEDWLEEVEDEELQDLNGDTPWKGPEVEEVMPPVRKKNSWIIEVCLGTALAIVFLGFFLKYREKTAPVPGSGFYYGCTSSYQDVTVRNQDDWIELLPDGTFRMQIMEASLKGRWRLEGDTFLGLMDRKELKGSLKDGVLTFPYMDMEFVFALPQNMDQVLKGETLPPVTVPAAENSYDLWAGDYYGSMVLSQGTGAWEGNSGEIYDVCGQIQVFEDDTGKLSLWNSQNKPGDRFCMADILFTEGTGEQGKFHVEWGTFYEMELGPGEWTVDPGKSPCAHLEGMLYFRGTYIDPFQPGDTFVYEIFLKPWGENWEDAKAFYEDPWMLPPQYETWYLPLIHGGQRMPEHF